MTTVIGTRLMMGVIEIPPEARCDRCAHRLREHAGPALGTICQVGRGRDTRRLCPCDGFAPEPK